MYQKILILFLFVLACTTLLSQTNTNIQTINTSYYDEECDLSVLIEYDASMLGYENNPTTYRTTLRKAHKKLLFGANLDAITIGLRRGVNFTGAFGAQFISGYRHQHRLSTTLDFGIGKQWYNQEYITEYPNAIIFPSSISLGVGANLSYSYLSRHNQLYVGGGCFYTDRVQNADRLGVYDKLFYNVYALANLFDNVFSPSVILFNDRNTYKLSYKAAIEVHMLENIFHLGVGSQNNQLLLSVRINPLAEQRYTDLTFGFSMLIGRVFTAQNATLPNFTVNIYYQNKNKKIY